MKEIRNQIVDLLQEAESNLTLYNTGKDDYAIKRYEQLMSEVDNLRVKLKKQQQHG